jgi:GNAT superfamily N-acetyltransferase
MATSEDLCGTQAALEGLRLDEKGHLERFKDMPGESGPPPRVVAIRYRGRKRIYLSADVDAEIESRVRRLSFSRVWRGHPELHEALCSSTENRRRAEYWTYTPGGRQVIAAHRIVQKLRSSDERLRGFSDGFFGIEYRDVFVVFSGGMVVAAAASSREDGRSAEAWVFVSPAHRRRGLARQVTTAWVQNAQERGLIPFYTHPAENVASRRLALSIPLSLRFVQAFYM